MTVPPVDLKDIPALGRRASAADVDSIRDIANEYELLEVWPVSPDYLDHAIAARLGE
jgi:hypothetical protein